MQVLEAVGIRLKGEIIDSKDINKSARSYPRAKFSPVSASEGNAGGKISIDYGYEWSVGVIETAFYNLLKMSDIRSNSSYAISAIEFNSKSLNPLDSLNPAVVAKIKRESEAYRDCAAKCLAIW